MTNPERYSQHQAEVEAEALHLERQADESYDDAERRIDETRAERGDFVEDIGLSISAKRENADTDTTAEIREQLEMAERQHLRQIQIDLRFRREQDFQGIAEMLGSFHERQPDIRLSLHIANPQVEGAHISNLDLIRKQLLLAGELGSISTIHPPSLKHDAFYGMSQEDQDTLISEYAQLLATPTLETSGRVPTSSVAIENMPAKGQEGRWGQTPEEVRMLVDAVMRELLERGLTMAEAKKYAGITLDINHALEGQGMKDPAVIERWLGMLGDRVKAIHVYTPSLGQSGRKKEEFEAWFAQITALYRKHHSEATVFIESSKDLETTLAMHTFAKAAALAPRAEKSKRPPQR